MASLPFPVNAETKATKNEGSASMRTRAKFTPTSAARKRRRLEEEDDGYFSRSHSPPTRAGPALMQQHAHHGMDFAPSPWTRQPQSALRPGIALTFVMHVMRGRGRGLP
ncbi:hypothetical protein C8J57DRAFT_1513562 [Mycena rebaudengoi]|nr:hypothetical protein C8J57DRAFT_1513562 [Mycena rebaudengoi]